MNEQKEKIVRFIRFLKKASKEDNRGILADLRRGFSEATEARVWPHLGRILADFVKTTGNGSYFARSRRVTRRIRYTTIRKTLARRQGVCLMNCLRSRRRLSGSLIAEGRKTFANDCEVSF